MRREVAYGLRSVKRGHALRLAAWSLPEAVPAALSGIAVARAVDTGFLVGRPGVGLAWLALIVAGGLVGALGSRQVLSHLGALVEPVRDDLVRRVVRGALRRGAAGGADDGAVARLTRQVEIVRDTYAGLIAVCRGFVVTSVGVTVGLLALSPLIAGLILPAFVVGMVAFLATLGAAAARQREAVVAEERLAAVAGQVIAGARDITATGTEAYATGLVAEPVRVQAAAERALATTAAIRTLCFAVGGWLPLLIVLAAGPWLVDRGLSAGAVMGGLTYVLTGLQPALRALISGLGGSGLRFVVTLARILDADVEAPRRPTPGATTAAVELDRVTFAFGPGAEPVLRDLSLTLHRGEHLAVVGPSGIGKSTLAALIVGLRRPDHGTVRLGLDRVLIPQEAYVFTGTLRENLRYLRPEASDGELAAAAAAVGAEPLMTRLGGLDAEIGPGALSAGERQLIALTRAYVAPAELVILDEATCHLDPAAETLAEEAFAARGGTLIVIAHRMSSALRAGRVLLLDGTGATLGDHAGLAASSPLYRELLGHWTRRPSTVG